MCYWNTATHFWATCWPQHLTMGPRRKELVVGANGGSCPDGGVSNNGEANSDQNRGETSNTSDHRSKGESGNSVIFSDNAVANISDLGCGQDGNNSETSSSSYCYLCSMHVTNINIHWRLNHRRVRIPPGTPKSLLGFSGGVESTSSSSRRSKGRKQLGLQQKRGRPSGPAPVVICSQLDPLEVYPDLIDNGDSSTIGYWNQDGLAGRNGVKFSLDVLSPAAQKSAVQSTVFLQQLSKYR